MTPGPTLDRDVEPWVASFPGLGHVTIACDGQLGVTTSDDAPPGAADALRHGWGELLAYQRQGITLVRAISLTLNGAALLVVGRADERSIVSLGLISRGWQLLADRPAPVTWAGGELIAHARSAPILVSRRHARRMGFPHNAVRGTFSDAMAATVPQADRDFPVAGVLVVRTGRPQDLTLTQPRGAARVSIASGIEVLGVLSQEEDPSARLVRDLQWAQLPMAELALGEDNLEADLDACTNWWMGLRT